MSLSFLYLLTYMLLLLVMVVLTDKTLPFSAHKMFVTTENFHLSHIHTININVAVMWLREGCCFGNWVSQRLFLLFSITSRRLKFLGKVKIFTRYLLVKSFSRNIKFSLGCWHLGLGAMSVNLQYALPENIIFWQLTTSRLEN